MTYEQKLFQYRFFLNITIYNVKLRYNVMVFVYWFVYIFYCFMSLHTFLFFKRKNIIHITIHYHQLSLIENRLRLEFNPSGIKMACQRSVSVSVDVNRSGFIRVWLIKQSSMPGYVTNVFYVYKREKFSRGLISIVVHINIYENLCVREYLSQFSSVFEESFCNNYVFTNNSNTLEDMFGPFKDNWMV